MGAGVNNPSLFVLIAREHTLNVYQIAVAQIVVSPKEIRVKYCSLVLSCVDLLNYYY